MAKFYQFRSKAAGGAAEPLSVDAAKRYLRVDGSDEDDDVEEMLPGVRRVAEASTDRLLRECDCTLELDLQDEHRMGLLGAGAWLTSGYCAGVVLPRGPLKRDESDAIAACEVTLDGVVLGADEYEVEESDTTLPKVLLKKAGKRLKVTFSAGHATGNVPENVVAAMKFVLGAWWTGRDVEDGKAASDREIPPRAKDIFEMERLY